MEYPSKLTRIFIEKNLTPFSLSAPSLHCHSTLIVHTKQPYDLIQALPELVGNAEIVVHCPRSSDRLLCHVGAGVDASSREFGKSDLKALLNRLKDFLVFGGADERDTETFGTETSCTADTMQVRVSILWQVVVDS
jgi:hypothetical protein